MKFNDHDDSEQYVQDDLYGTWSHLPSVIESNAMTFCHALGFADLSLGADDFIDRLIWLIPISTEISKFSEITKRYRPRQHHAVLDLLNIDAQGRLLQGKGIRIMAETSDEFMIERLDSSLQRGLRSPAIVLDLRSTIEWIVEASRSEEAKT